MTPEKGNQKRWSRKKKLENMPAFTLLQESIRETTAYIPKSELLTVNAMIVEGNYRDEQGNMVTIPMIPIEVYRIIRRDAVLESLEIVDLRNALETIPSGIDIQRAHELYSSIKEDGTAMITSLPDEEGKTEKVQVNISTRMIAEALNVSDEGVSFRAKKDVQGEVFKKKGAAATFEDMTNIQVRFPTRLFMQFFMADDKRPARFTTPNHTAAITYTWANQQIDPVILNHAELIFDLLTKKKKHEVISYLGAPEMLTKIAYFALGKTDELPPSPSQLDWIENTHEEEIRIEQETRSQRAKRRRRAGTEEEEVSPGKDKKPMSSKQAEKEDRAQREALFERRAEEFRKQRADEGDFEDKWKPKYEQETKRKADRDIPQRSQLFSSSSETEKTEESDDSQRSSPRPIFDEYEDYEDPFADKGSPEKPKKNYAASPRQTAQRPIITEPWEEMEAYQRLIIENVQRMHLIARQGKDEASEEIEGLNAQLRTAEKQN